MKYHWLSLIATLWVIICIYQWDLQPAWTRLHNAREQQQILQNRFNQNIEVIKQENKLKQQIKALQNIISLDNQVEIHHEIENILLKDITITGITIKLLQSRKENHRQHFHLILDGTFEQLCEFISLIAQDHHLIAVTDCVIRAEKNGSLSSELNLASTSYLHTIKFPILNYNKNNFGSLVNNQIQSLENTVPNVSLSEISVRLVKYVGFIQYQSEKCALLMLPNGQTSTVKNHDRVGVEQAVVSDVNESAVTVELAGQKIRIHS